MDPSMYLENQADGTRQPRFPAEQASGMIVVPSHGTRGYMHGYVPHVPSPSDNMDFSMLPPASHFLSDNSTSTGSGTFFSDSNNDENLDSSNSSAGFNQSISPHDELSSTVQWNRELQGLGTRFPIRLPYHPGLGNAPERSQMSPPARVRQGRTVTQAGTERRHKRPRLPSAHGSAGTWLSHALCSLWRRNHLRGPTLSDLNSIGEAFDLSPQVIYETWTDLYGRAGDSMESTPANLKSRYLDAFCSLWRLACLHLDVPSDTQMEALAQALGTNKGEVQAWFDNKAAARKVEAPAEIEAEAVQRFKHNQRACMKQEDSKGDLGEFKLPARDQARPLVCTTGCGKNFPNFKEWKKHEEKNWPQQLWCCALNDCPRRRNNKHVFFRTDTFESHITAYHNDKVGDVKNIKNRAKRSDFSEFPKHCVFWNCNTTFTKWKQRIDHLEYEFRNREWRPEDWRDYESDDQEIDDDAMDDDTDGSASDDADGDDAGRDNAGPSGHSHGPKDWNEDDDNDGEADDDDNNNDQGGGGRIMGGLSRSQGISNMAPEDCDSASDTASELSVDSHGGQDSSTSISSFPSVSQEPKHLQTSLQTSPMDSDHPLSSLIPFEYDSLESERHIRLLQLSSKSSWTLIQSSLAECPAYTALSYTSGAEQLSRPVICNGQWLEVPTICYDALNYLRHAQIFRRQHYVWIDAVCVDRSNVTERNQQVDMMEDIYRNAARAILWLGKPGCGSWGMANHQVVAPVRSISLVTFDDIIGSKESRPLAPEKLREDNFSLSRKGSMRSQSLFSMGHSEPLSGKDSMSSSMLSLPMSGHATVQSFQFQMGYQCFEESAAQVESWLQPDLEIPIAQTGSCRVDRVHFNGSQHVFARKIIQLKTASQLFFPQEAISMRRLHHPHIVQLVLGYLSGDKLSILMSPVADCNLQQYMQSRSIIRPVKEDHWKWFSCLISGLIYMHDKGLRHRDIKPSNILVRDGEVFYADLGLSNDTNIDSSENTLIGNFTRQYAAPEFAEGVRGKASDIWSLGCVFLELLTVLSGHRIAQFYQLPGTTDLDPKETAYYMNQEAMRGWINKLKESLLAKIPSRNCLVKKHKLVKSVVFACEDMTVPIAAARPSARELSFRFKPNGCCSKEKSFLPAHQAATSFLQELHWKMLNYIIHPQKETQESSIYSDLVKYRGIISRFSEGPLPNCGHKELLKQVRTLTENLGEPGSYNGQRFVNDHKLDVKFDINPILEDLEETDSKEDMRDAWTELSHRLNHIASLVKKGKTSGPDENESTQPYSQIALTTSTVGAEPSEANAQAQASVWPHSSIPRELPIVQCCYSYKHNDQVLVGAAWFVYRELGWSLKEAMSIAVSLEKVPGTKCELTTNSICSQVCSIRFDQSVRKVRKTIEKTRRKSSKIYSPRLPISKIDYERLFRLGSAKVSDGFRRVTGQPRRIIQPSCVIEKPESNLSNAKQHDGRRFLGLITRLSTFG